MKKTIIWTIIALILIAGAGAERLTLFEEQWDEGSGNHRWIEDVGTTAWIYSTEQKKTGTHSQKGVGGLCGGTGGCNTTINATLYPRLCGGNQINITLYHSTVLIDEPDINFYVINDTEVTELAYNGGHTGAGTWARVERTLANNYAGENLSFRMANIISGANEYAYYDNITITCDDPLIIHSITPNSTFYTPGTAFNINVTTESTANINCTFYVNGAAQYTRTEIKGTNNTNLTQTYSTGDKTILVNCTDDYGNTETISTNITDPSRLITITINDWTGTLLSTTNATIQNDSYSTINNPFQIYRNRYLNSSITEMNSQITLIDRSSQHQTETTDFNITYQTTALTYQMTANQLVLTFNQSGSAENTYGQCMDSAGKQYSWNDTSLTILQANFSYGPMKCRFAMESGGIWGATNHTQFYEYINDGTPMAETIEILQEEGQTVFFEVLTPGGSPIQNAQIRIALAGWNSEVMLTGQRLTDHDGKTFFYLDEDTMAHAVISADGYLPTNVTFTTADEGFTRGGEKQIILTPTTTSVTRNRFVGTTRSTWWNRSETIYGTITAMDATSVQITTDYMNNLGLNRTTLTGDTLGRYRFQLDSGEEYNSTGDTNITLYVYVNGALHGTYTIRYDSTAPTNLFEGETASVPFRWLDPLIAIAIILLAAGVGVLFRNEDFGFHTFMIGSIIATTISMTFAWTALICGLYYGLRFIRGIINE